MKSFVHGSNHPFMVLLEGWCGG